MPRSSCWRHDGWRKFADGPPTSDTYPFQSGWCVMASTSRMTLAWLRLVIMRPWWNASAQKLHPPKQPRLWITLKRTSSIAGTPPSGSYMGCHSRV